uniref:Prolyl 4-hydroxylase alpha subunit Fe(2+) 2OG dioxygenase domain-containing protein n=1 Tax=Kalanchoe fedtschenkoi TaxID=63787 RepID=A0A7N0TG64_KALFE
MVDDDGPPRLILQDFLTAEECKELEFIHKSCCTIGYRPGVLSTTLSHLIATNCSHLILPFVRIRERLKDKVEDFFGCEFELFVEFTGGLFHFQSGEPKTVVPTTGEVVIYTADSRNIHSVDEVLRGERLTLTLWFTRDRDHDEDSKLISLLSQSLLNHAVKDPDLYLPLPAPSNMYWFSSDQATDSQCGFNICWARIHALGFDLYSSGDACSCELLMEPLQLVRGMELCELRFNNILHVLQVVQFYIWKSFGFQSNEVERPKGEAIVSCSKTQQEKIIKLRSIYLDDLQMAETLLKSCFGDMSNRFSFDWTAISKATEAWKWYTNKLQNDLIMSLHYWMSEQSLFFVPIDEL